jgi:hypothetical protein
VINESTVAQDRSHRQCPRHDSCIA